MRLNQASGLVALDRTKYNTFYMNKVESLHRSIVADLEAACQGSRYKADANEPDPRYKSYGVRSAGKKTILASYRPAIRQLQTDEKLELAGKLIASEYGEQQSIALHILEPVSGYFTPDKFSQLDQYVRYLHGWSKIDSYTGTLLRDVLFNFPDEMVDLVRSWNQDDDLWLRRASVVLFTRKVAELGRFTDIALSFCEALLFDQEILVQKGVGWSLKDHLRHDKERILDYIIDLRKRGVSSVIILYALRDLKGEDRAAVLNIK